MIRRALGGRAGGRTRTRALLAAGSLLVCAGCANVPTGGRVFAGEPARAVGQPDQPYVRVVPVSPLGKDWPPDQMVTGFLTASGSFDDQHRVAKQYLAANVSWRPDPRPSVIVTDQRPQTRIIGKAADGSTVVEASAFQLGMIGADGQYTAVPRPLTETFHLAQAAKGEWRISQLPADLADGLLLSQQDMQRVFRTRNLYFFAPDGKALVPDPVFLPLTDRSDLPSQIVRAQLKNPTVWLSGAVLTQFPGNTQLLDPVDVSADGTATVNLSKEAAKGNRAGMSAQLMWALIQLPEVKHLRLQIGGQTVKPSPSVDSIQSPRDWAGSGPDEAAGDGSGDLPVFATDATGHLAMFSATGHTFARVAAAQGRPMVQSAVSFDRRQVAALSPDGGSVYAGDSGTPGSITPILDARQGARFVKPSWDRSGNLWVVETAQTRSWLWVRQPGGRPVQVGSWALADSRVLALRVALDGVRTAAIVADSSGKGSIVLGRIAKDKSGQLTADTFLPISSTKIDDAIDLAWMDADHLAVLGKAVSAAQPQPYDVPVGGGPVYSIGTGTPGGMHSIAAAPGAPVLVGQQIAAQTGATPAPQQAKLCWLRDSNDQLYSEWDCNAPGTDPAYPG